jgi:MSHA pilin protein MshC
MNQRGFTLIELVMVLVLIGIIALFAAPRLGNIPTTKAFSLADKLRADIRYAQNLAMTRNQRYRVYVNNSPAPAGPGGGYAVVNDANGNGTWGEAGEFAQDPAGTGNLSVVLDAGDYAGITVSPNTFIEFNSLGSPTTGGTTLTVSPGGTTLTVTAETGAVN